MADTKCQVCGADTQAFLCRKCGRELEQAIAELPADATDLEAVMTRQARGPLGLGLRDRQWEGPFEEGSLGDASWEFAPGAADQLWAMRNTLSTWIRHLDESRDPLAPQKPVFVEVVRVFVIDNRWRIARETRLVRDSREVSIEDLATLLVDQLESIRFDEAAAVIYDELVGLHTENGRWILGRSQVEEFLGFCDAAQVTFALDGDTLVPQAAVCGVTLYGRQGEPEVKCPACGARYDSAERHSRIWAQEIDSQLARAHAIADALTTNDEPLSPTLLRKWIQRDAAAEVADPTKQGPACEECEHRTCAALRRAEGRVRILEQGRDDDGNALYRVGDVRARLAQVTAQRGAKLSA